MTGEFNAFAEELAEGRDKGFAPPFTAYEEEDRDIISFCTAFFERYLGRVRSMSPACISRVNALMSAQVEFATEKSVVFDLLSETAKICEVILDGLACYFKGFPSVAYEEIERVFTADGCHLLNLLPQYQIDRGTFYRIRKGTAFRERKEFFHTPFERRALCDTRRYSIQGYPSLYLTTSLETAVREQDAVEAPGNYSFAKFRNTRHIRVVDLSLPSKLPLNFWSQYSLVLFYPLIVSCSLKVKHPDHPFKPEYIIPQILFEMIRLHGREFDGVCYTSTKYPRPDFTDYSQRNLVIYVPSADQQSGYSAALARKWQCSLPKSCLPGEGQNFKNLELSVRDEEMGRIL